MRKSLLLLLAVVLYVCVPAWGNASAQPPEVQAMGPMSEEMEQMGVMSTIAEGMMKSEFLQSVMLFPVDADEMGITREQIENMREKLAEAQMVLIITEVQKKFGEGPPPDITSETIADIVEIFNEVIPKINDAARKAMADTLSAETVKRLDVLAFQTSGGVFGGALNVDNLAPLNLSDEQKEKAAQIVEKLNRERLELFFLMDIDIKPGEEPDAEKMKETLEKVVSLTRRGQGEIEALLTDEQKKLAAQLMAEVPEKYRFMSDYLAKRPWRLDESNWKPGDGVPDYPNPNREVTPERTDGRPFPGN